MADLRESVKELRAVVDALAANVEPMQDKVLRLNVREARASTSLRVQQLSPATLTSMVGTIRSPCDIQGRHALDVPQR
jgi:phage shock protein A